MSSKETVSRLPPFRSSAAPIDPPRAKGSRCIAAVRNGEEQEEKEDRSMCRTRETSSTDAYRGITNRTQRMY